MKKIFPLIIFLGLLAHLGFAQSKINADKSSVTFTIKNFGSEVDGSFSGLEANIKFDKNDLANSRLEGTIDASTINTSNNMRDKHLKKEEYFDVENYPKIQFAATEIMADGSGYIAKGELALKGVKKSIEIPFTVEGSGNTQVFKGSIELNRLDYKVGKSSWVMSDDVKIKIVCNIEKPDSSSAMGQ